MTDPVTVPQAPALARVPNVELMHTGTWQLSTGQTTFTTDDLMDAVAALGCSAVRRPILKLGHNDPRFDGEPCIGWVDHLAVVDGGRTLIGDYTGMPGWLGDVMASAYPDRSIEGEWNHQCQMGHTHPFVVHAVALLGVAAPGIGTLESLQDVATLYGVVAAGSHTGTPVFVQVEGSSPVPSSDSSRMVSAGVSAEDVMRAFYDSELGSGWDAWAEELQLDPLQLIYVNDKDNARSRVPITIRAGEGDEVITFGDPVPVTIRYVDVAAARPTTNTLKFTQATRAAYAAAVGSHSTATKDGAWSKSTHIGRLPDDASDAVFRKVFAWKGEGEGKSAWKFPHHEVGADGTPGAANTTACSAGIAALNGGRGGASIPDGDRSGVHAHLAKHLKDAGKDVPELASASAVAAKAAQEGRPPMEFTDDQLAAMRTSLGLDESADADAVLAAISERSLPPAPPPALPEGTVVVDSAQLDELKVAAAAGVAARTQQEQEAREHLVHAAISDGRIPPSRRDHWIGQLKADPGSADVLASLSPGLGVPLTEIGHSGTADTADDALYAKLWGAPAGSER